MKRSFSVTDILNKKYKTFPFDGPWADAFDQPERCGRWFIWGSSGNGKTSFVMQLCKKLCQYDTVLYVSLEEGAGLTMQRSLMRFGMGECGSRFNLTSEDMDALRNRLRRRKSPSIIVIDSFQYTRMTYADYISLKEEFPQKLFIFISHASGRNPKGDAATGLMFDADLKIWIEGYKAFSKGRYIGQTGEFTIWEVGAAYYWGAADRKRR
jgi:GTPase SAR1 family protein